MLVDPSGCLEPKAREIRVDVLNADAEQNICRERTLADDRIIDVSSSAAEIVEVRKRVQDVKPSALEKLKIVLLEVVRQRGELLLAGVVIVFVMMVKAREVRVLLNNLGS